MAMASAIEKEQLNFNEIYNLYHKLIYHIAYCMTKDPHVSEDITQETFLKAFLKLDTLFDKEKIGNWLSAIARRTAIDVIRKNKGASDVALEEEYFLEKQSTELVEEAIEYRFLKNEVQEEISTLKPSYRDVMVLKVYSGLKDKEIAKQLKLSTATVKTRLHRARQQLKVGL
ncbi:RNA polymerase sigma factor [Metabacillus arenae]|uniref:Sigma-70 family RNA polymerase sigma factor n=1 Tax=Metabacillus arenae TaxID=2771434 RepID=A0A926RYL6_9BACI|nr:sigma-70 family RNA polymerase sigma factor [Metabacillus arenae]MBD1381302.1 sigma-70 family RNA polymerase sigma factor [Metabacillus arenae]